MNVECIWRGFPKTVTEFGEAFPDKEACRRFLVELRDGEASLGALSAAALTCGSWRAAVSSVPSAGTRGV